MVGIFKFYFLCVFFSPLNPDNAHVNLLEAKKTRRFYRSGREDKRIKVMRMNYSETLMIEKSRFH